MTNVETLFKIDLINMENTIKAAKSKISYTEAQNVIPKYLDLKVEDLIGPIKEDTFVLTQKKIIKTLEKANDNKNNLGSEIRNQNESLRKYILGYHLTESLKTLFKDKSLKDRLKIITNTLGLSFERNNIYTVMSELLKCSCITQKNTHIVLTGDKDYGKSFLFDCILKEKFDYNIFNKYAGIPTTADLRGSKTEKNKETAFTLLDRNILIFDEIADITKDPDSIPLLKASLESKDYKKFESEVKPTNSSIIMIGNTYFSPSSLKDLSLDMYIPKIINDRALLDRFSAILPHNKNLFGERILATNSNDHGIPAIHLISILFYLRHREYKNNQLLDYLKDKKGREYLAISNLASGLLKLLYPDNDSSKWIVEGIVEFANHFRSLTQGEVHNPFTSKSSRFLIETLKEDDIEYSLLLKNRLFMKVKNQNLCKKIAFTNFGAEDNKLEFEINKKYPDSFNKIFAKDNSFISISQEINAPLATSRKLYENNNNIKQAGTAEFNNLLLENIEYAASISHPCPLNKFIGVPDFIHNQIGHYMKSKLTQGILNEFKLKIPGASDISKNSYTFGQETLEIINIAQYKITK